MTQLSIKRVFSKEEMLSYSEILRNSIYAKSKLLQFAAINSFDDAHLVFALFVFKHNIPLAQLGVYNNPELIYNNQKVLAIGNFECIYSDDISDLLFTEVERYAKEIGCIYIIGPMNGSTWSNYRFIVQGDEKVFFTETFHPGRYNTLFLNAGFTSIAKYISARDVTLNCNKAEIESTKNKFIEKGVTFRNMRLEKFDEELKKIYHFTIQSFKNNFLYTPITYETFYQKYFGIKGFINSSYVLLSEYKGELAGLIFCIEDIYNTEQKSLIIKTLARLNIRELAGLGTLLGDMIIQKAAEDGFSSVIHAFMHEQNVSAKISEDKSGEVFRRYALYAKSIK
ncbi:MAG: hypothetical protein H7Y00_10105 [Fimbriimonadaceae bacterium]|nr:hypothetical protein [Chitinophagales bacterium]